MQACCAYAARAKSRNRVGLEGSEGKLVESVKHLSIEFVGYTKSRGGCLVRLESDSSHLPFLPGGR